MNNWQDNYLFYSWEGFKNAANKLGGKIQASGKKFDLIVSIARGGLSLSQILSDYLNLTIATFTIISYKDMTNTQMPQITYRLSASLINHKILLVDDVSDTGKTFIRGIEHLVELGAKKTDIQTASLNIKPHTTHFPDFYVGKTNKWIIYPYEVRETIKALKETWKKDKLNPTQIQNRLKKLGFTDSDLKFL